ncbi:MAG: endonuclease/exonuclease/phosphatase family protein [Prevotellaceae bacterium]|jgi:endonuclease/exonuclease/phosphatase family metal-dependent hydrolase|nr:endonuclease/exonuclease/phosphatase family protein [Prevotellaceae bacterium]
MKKLRFIISGLFFLWGIVCSAQELNVMSFNIRLNTPKDGENAWTHRKESAAKCIAFHNVDIVGLQEAQHNQVSDLQTALPDYEIIGVGRADGKTAGEYCAIAYRKSRFTVLESGTFWLSENSEAIGKKGWDAACERIVTWAKMKDKITKRTFVFANTHFDHVGQVARRESSKLLMDKMKQIADKLPLIVTGDFNARATDEAIQYLTDTAKPDKLVDSRTIAKIKYGPEWSYHGFNKLTIEQRKQAGIIDFIFLRGKIKALRHGIIDGTGDGTTCLSDHHPAFCSLIIEK